MKSPLIGGLAVVGALAAASPALAIDYPAPTDPGQVQKAPKGPHRTLKVGPHARFHSIQKAVNAAKAGDTIKLADGRYRESVKIVRQALDRPTLDHPAKAHATARLGLSGDDVGGRVEIGYALP